MHKTPYVFPIIGGRKIEHLKSNIQALDVVLTQEQIQSLESVIPFDIGFPQNFFVSPGSILSRALCRVTFANRGMEPNRISHC